jgi:hypothetical protein
MPSGLWQLGIIAGERGVDAGQGNVKVCDLGVRSVEDGLRVRLGA